MDDGVVSAYWRRATKKAHLAARIAIWVILKKKQKVGYQLKDAWEFALFHSINERSFQ
jgi:hypothetical protein